MVDKQLTVVFIILSDDRNFSFFPFLWGEKKCSNKTCIVVKSSNKTCSLEKCSNKTCKVEKKFIQNMYCRKNSYKTCIVEKKFKQNM